jgi:gamma-glutamyl-gamma-aminobutyrate hydrolase PuuD
VLSTNECYGNNVRYDYVKPLDNEHASYIGLITNENYDFIDEKVLDLCDGILMTGGVEIKDYHIALIRYVFKHKIPFLGICQGAQALGLATLTGSHLIKIDDGFTSIDHAPKDKKLVHIVNFESQSLLHELFGDTIGVNSNHRYALPMVKEPMRVVGISEDGIIEAIEHVDKDVFTVGVQWHPELLENMQPLFNAFVNKARERCESRVIASISNKKDS